MIFFIAQAPLKIASPSRSIHAKAVAPKRQRREGGFHALKLRESWYNSIEVQQSILRQIAEVYPTSNHSSRMI
jgi:hypothetical protein